MTKSNRLPPKEAMYDTIPENMNPKLIDALKQKGIQKLYCHQCSAFRHKVHQVAELHDFISITGADIKTYTFRKAHRKRSNPGG